MKKIIFLLSLFIALQTQAQNTRVTADKVEAKSLLQVGSLAVSGISNDTTAASKSAFKLITERAAKLYADQLGSPVDWFSVYKASGDNTGAIDVSDIVKTAIDQGKRVIYFPTGRFKIGTTIYPTDTISFIGNARGGTTLIVEDNIPAFKLSPTTGGRMCQFRDITFVGTKSGGATTAQQAILVDSTDQVYIDNVSAFNFGGYAIEVKNNGYCCATYVWNATRGNIISDVYVSESYGGVSFSNRAEYNIITGSTFVQNTYGIQNIGGNNRISNTNSSNNQYGFYGAGGSNHGHGVAVGSTFNHNSVYNAYVNGVTNSFIFSGCTFLAGGSPGKVYVKNSNNISFEGCMFLANDSIIVENSTNTKFTDPTFWQGDPKWLITGETPGVFFNNRVNGGISLYDPKNNKQFDIIHSNGLTNLTGANVGINKASPVYGLDINRSIGVNKDSISSMTGKTEGIVVDTTTGQLGRQRLITGSGIADAISVWNATTGLTGYSGAKITNSSAPILTLTGSSTTTNPRLTIINTGTGGGAGAHMGLWNDVSKDLGIYVGASNNNFIPNWASIYTGTLDGISIVSTIGKIRFGRNFNRNNSVTMSLENNGNVLIGTTTDDGYTRAQISGSLKATDTISGNLVVARNVIWKGITASDADVTAVAGASYVLPDITANRNFVVPSVVEGSVIEIFVENTTGFMWQATGEVIYDPAGNPFTSLAGSQVFVIRAIGGKWRLVSSI